jgi:hypothetical protein
MAYLLFSPILVPVTSSPSKLFQTSTIPPISGMVPCFVSEYPPTDDLPRSGRWRSEYRVDIAEKKAEGKVLVNVHYYEQGNVRFL